MKLVIIMMFYMKKINLIKIKNIIYIQITKFI